MASEQQISSGIRALSRAILDDTKGEAERIVSEAQEASRRIEQQAQEESGHIRRDILADAEARISHMEQQSMATARLEAQRLLLASREEMIDEVFRAAEAHLQDIPKLDSYPAILRGLIVEAVERLGEPAAAQVRVAERDIPLVTDAMLEAVAKRWKGRVHLSLGEPADIVGGVIIEADEGRKRSDSSLRSRLEVERNRLRAEVYRLLRGEA